MPRPQPPDDLWQQMDEYVEVKRGRGKRVECRKAQVNDGRCVYLTRTGRRCRNLRSRESSLCASHTRHYY